MSENLLYEEIYQKTQDCGRTQFVKLLQQNQIKIEQLQKERQQLISFLEDRIKEYKKWQKCLYEKENTKLLEKATVGGYIGAFKEVLDFVKKGGKK